MNFIHSIPKELVLVLILYVLHINRVPRTVCEVVMKDINRIVLDVAQIQGVSRDLLDDLNLTGGCTTRKNGDDNDDDDDGSTKLTTRN